MKAIMVMFDSLNRHMLPPYGCDWVHAPNFERLAARTVTFDRSFVGSMPCMPARRELHTGRCNFLHRSWGPMEPFDDSMPEILKRNRVCTHLVTDHYHYWEDGGCTYHNRYTTWDFHRGQEGDPWIGQVADPKHPPAIAIEQRVNNPRYRQDWINRDFMPREEDHYLYRTMHAGLDFIRRNAAQDRWLLHLECFDPHEPFFAPQKYRDLYPHKYSGDRFDWPPYREVRETPEQIEHCRLEYAALVSMVDAYLGKVLDLMDELDLWKDTMLLINCDHGHMLGERNCWAKCWQPWYNELANMPLFIWDPRCPQAAGQRRASFAQTIDLPATLLEYFGQPLPPDMMGRPLARTVADDTPARPAGLFGLFGAQVNVTDGRYVYMRGPASKENRPCFEYTLMPTRMSRRFNVRELCNNIELAEPFSFTKGCRTMKIAGSESHSPSHFQTLLYDLQADPQQQRPLKDAALERRMIDLLISQMRQCDAPPEQYQRLGLKA